MAGQKVLIIDDGKTIRMQVKEMLPKGAFEVLEAQDGVEGLNLIRQERPSLILLDFFMPRMNGWEVIEHLQTQPELKKIPLVIMSGRKEEVTAKIPNLSINFEFIEKPFEQKALINAVKAAMVKAKERQQPVANPPKPSVQEQATATPSVGIDEIKVLKAEITAL